MKPATSQSIPQTSAQVLVYGQGPVDEAFSKQLARQGTLVRSTGSQRPQDFALVVVEGSSVPPDQLSRLAQDFQAAMENNRPLLVLQPSLAHKQALAAAGILRHYIQEPSLALLIEPRRDKANQLRAALYEQFPNVSGSMELASARKEGDGAVQQEAATQVSPGDPTGTPVDYSAFLERLDKSVSLLATGEVLQLDTTSSSSPSNPPSNIPASLYDVTPITLYQTLSTGTASTKDDYTPPQGSFLLQGLVTIGVYYDNTSFNTPVQWLIIDHSGLCQASIKANDKTHLGWSLGALNINGQNISSSSLAYRQSSPNTLNNVTSYTSSSSFTVGLSAGTDGLSGNTSYTIGSSQTSSISDWSIVQNSSNSWSFAQATPYNGATSGFPDDSVDAGGINTLPAISMTSLSFGTETVWCRTPATQQNTTVQYQYQVGGWFIYEDNPGWVWHADSWHATPSCTKTYSINFSRAWPSGS